MIAECVATMRSISSVVFRISPYSDSPNPVDLCDGGHFGTV